MEEVQTTVARKNRKTNESANAVHEEHEAVEGPREEQLCVFESHESCQWNGTLW